jgi:hypothetical protein
MGTPSPGETVGTLLLNKVPVLWISRNPNGTAHIRRIECPLGPDAEWDSDTTPEEWIRENRNIHKLGGLGKPIRASGFQWK